MSGGHVPPLNKLKNKIMETTIRKTVKGATMGALFDGCQLFSIKYFKALNLQSEADYKSENRYKYEILIRHSENTDANVLFEEARFVEECKRVKEVNQ